MCLQCITNSVEIGRFGEISVQLSQKDNLTWPSGSVGLVISNDPFKVFSGFEFKIDPNFNGDSEFTNAEIDAFNEFFDAVDLFEHEGHNQFDASDGHRLYQEMLNNGYNPKIHGYRWVAYFIHRVAEMLESFRFKVQLT